MGPNKPSGMGGPIVLFWNADAGSATTAQEALTVFGAGAVQEVQDLGGIVAAPDKTTHLGQLTGLYWFSGDVPFADQLVACAIQQRHIDTQHIHSVGFAGGGHLSTYLWYVRSGYIASVATYWGGLEPIPTGLQDPSHMPAALVQHGDLLNSGAYGYLPGTWLMDLKQRKAFFIDCNDGTINTGADSFSIAP
jgi:poly(3-hydroxybutyrate) depolymerase